MSDPDAITRLIEGDRVARSLRRGSPDRSAVRALQRLLFELGYGDLLGGDDGGADGIYGSATVAAVRAFCRGRGRRGGGERVTGAMARALVEAHDRLDPLRRLAADADAGRVARVYRAGGGNRVAIASLQTLLHAAGYGAELDWARYGADGVYGAGTAAAVRAFATDAHLEPDGSHLTPEMATRLIDWLVAGYGPDWRRSVRAGVDPAALTIREEARGDRIKVAVADDTVTARFVRFRRGLYTYGREKPREFIRANRAALVRSGLTDSALDVILSVADNEGNFDAVNTWDNAFLSFGMFQWTAGSGSAKGELAALLGRLKRRDPATFAACYRDHGLDVTAITGPAGHLTLDGIRLDTPERKEPLRAAPWAFRLWRSGREDRVKQAQVEHALARIDTFWRSTRYRIGRYFVSDLVTSQWGVALVLDNHVNRPGYVAGCLAQALRASRLPAPAGWRTEEEGTLIDAYLKVREGYGRSPMTDAAKRAGRTRRYLRQGLLSAERGSFSWR